MQEAWKEIRRRLERDGRSVRSQEEDDKEVDEQDEDEHEDAAGAC